MIVGDLLDLKKEIAKKEEFVAHGDIQQFLDALYSEFQFDLSEFQGSFKEFNDRSPSEYFDLNREDATVYVPPPLDPQDWKNHMRWNEQRDKFDSLLSFLIDLNFKCEPTSRDLYGTISKEMGNIAEGVIDYAELLDQGEEKAKLADYSMYRDGTVAEQIQWVERTLTRKIGPAWKPNEDPNKYVGESREVDGFIGIETKTMKLHRVFLGDVSQPFIEKQPHIWLEYVIPYTTARTIFGNYYMWKYVKPFRQTQDMWTDTDTDIEKEDKGEADKVRVRIREDIQADSYVVMCNKVPMTPIGQRMPETGHYSITWQRASLLDPDFGYGRSFLANMRPFSVTLDAWRNITLDIGRQKLEPPMASRFRFLVNKYMFKPASVINNAGEGGLTPLIPQTGNDNFTFEVMKMLEANIDKSSVSPVFQGQNQKGIQTKYEVEQMLINSIRAVAGLIGASVARRQQRASAILRLALKYYPKLVGNDSLKPSFYELKKISIMGGESMTKKNIIFHTDNEINPLQVRKMLNQQRNLTKAVSGESDTNLVVDVAKLDSFKTIIDYRVNPQQRDSKSSDMANLEKRYAMYKNDPNINPEAPTKMMLRANNDDEDEFLLKKQPMQPGMQPGQPQAPGAPTPGQAPQDPGLTPGGPGLPGQQNPQDAVMQAAMQ